MTEPQKSDDEKQRDDILRRMLKTPPKPHKPAADDKPQPSPAMRVEKTTRDKT